MALTRVSTVDALATALRREILDGERPAGLRLVERELCERFDVARHTLRAALRALAGEGLVRLEPHRGATVARLDAEQVAWLYELRAALELEAAHLALERNGGVLPAEVHAALGALETACAGPDPAWSAIADRHLALHAAIVGAAGSPRIAAAHAALAGEMRLFLLQLKPLFTGAGLARDHAELIDRLEREGPQALREHLRDAAVALTRELRVGDAGRTALGRRPPG
jgi:DNA-binding GntR family transcriptional regulator